MIRCNQQPNRKLRQASRTSLLCGVPRDVRVYLAHTKSGLPMRDIARQFDCHASTILRRIRRIEGQRDDPLIDAALRRLEVELQLRAPPERWPDFGEGMTMGKTFKDSLSGGTDTSDKEAIRVLRRMCEKGAVLALARDMDIGVVVREGADGSTTRTAVVAQDVAQAMALNGLIEGAGQGRVMRYRITALGRDKVRAVLDIQADEEAAAPNRAFAEAPAQFAPAVVGGENEALPTSRTSRRHRYDLGESPITVLARRRDRDGAPFLSDDLVRSGERLREDFELAQMATEAQPNWEVFVTSGEETSQLPVSPEGYGPKAAQTRVRDALRELGPGLGEIALRCCCYLEGLERTEQHMGWSARSGKIVLRIALQRLKRHYDETLTQDSQLIG